MIIFINDEWYINKELTKNVPFISLSEQDFSDRKISGKQCSVKRER